jgi:hypothetical protein
MLQDPIQPAVDSVDSSMKMLGSSLNLLDPDGSLKSVLPQVPDQELLQKMMQEVCNDYRNLSDAIHALRKEVEEKG